MHKNASSDSMSEVVLNRAFSGVVSPGCESKLVLTTTPWGESALANRTTDWPPTGTVALLLNDWLVWVGVEDTPFFFHKRNLIVLRLTKQTYKLLGFKVMKNAGVWLHLNIFQNLSQKKILVLEALAEEVPEAPEDDGGE